MNLGEKIKELRLKNNMTQDDLASRCYVTRNAVSKWENDKGYPNIESIKLLCKCFNITIDELLSDEINNEVVKELTVEVIKDDISYLFEAGENKNYRFKFKPGVNNLTLKGNGTIEFKFRKEVL